MTMFFKIASGIISVCMAIFFVGILLILFGLFCGLLCLVAPIIILFAICILTKIIYDEMILYINQHTFTDYIEITDKDDK